MTCHQCRRRLRRGVTNQQIMVADDHAVLIRIDDMIGRMATDTRNNVGVDVVEETSGFILPTVGAVKVISNAVWQERVDHGVYIPYVEEPVDPIDEVDRTCSVLSRDCAVGVHRRKPFHGGTFCSAALEGCKLALYRRLDPSVCTQIGYMHIGQPKKFPALKVRKAQRVGSGFANGHPGAPRSCLRADPLPRRSPLPCLGPTIDRLAEGGRPHGPQEALRSGRDPNPRFFQ